MKVISQDALTKLIQLSKDSFVDKNDAVQATPVQLATVATTGDYSDLTNTPVEIPSQTGNSGKFLTTNGSAVSWATVNALPSQSGNSGKYLTTNGTSASWATVSIPTVDQTYSSSSTSTNALSHKAIADAKFLQNTATGTNSLTILGSSNSNAYSINIGNYSSVTENFSVAIGCGSSSADATTASRNSIAIGYDTKATGTSSISIGTPSKATGTSSIQIGPGTNSEANSLYIGTSSSNNWKLLGSDGKIPDDRLNTPIPSQTGNSGKFLTTNGTSVSWATVSAGDSLPDQTGNSGKFLTTNGTSVSWENVPSSTITFRTWSD